MINELDRILEEVRKDKDLDKETLIKTLEAALLKAAKNRYGHNSEIEGHFNHELGEVELFQFRNVVKEVKNPKSEISLEESKNLDPEAQIGDSLGVKLNTADFGRIAAQTAKQVIIQNIREAERENTYQNARTVLVAAWSERTLLAARRTRFVPTGTQAPPAGFQRYAVVTFPPSRGRGEPSTATVQRYQPG